VESKRGGGGHISIRRINLNTDSNYLMHIIMCIGDSISQQSAEIFINNFIDYDAITEREGKLMLAAVSDKVIGGLGLPMRDIVRASILKNMLAGIM
jgi:transcriptional regulator CtsR